MSALVCGAELKRLRGKAAPTCDRLPGHDGVHTGAYLGMIVTWYEIESAPSINGGVCACAEPVRSVLPGGPCQRCRLACAVEPYSPSNWSAT